MLKAAQAAAKELYVAKREEKVEQADVKKDFAGRFRAWRDNAYETEDLSRQALLQEEKDEMKRDFAAAASQDAVLEKVENLVEALSSLALLGVATIERIERLKRRDTLGGQELRLSERAPRLLLRRQGPPLAVAIRRRRRRACIGRWRCRWRLRKRGETQSTVCARDSGRVWGMGPRW